MDQLWTDVLDRYGPYAFGVLSVWILWKYVVGPTMEASRIAVMEQSRGMSVAKEAAAIARDAAATAKAAAGIAERASQNALASTDILTRSIGRIESISDRLHQALETVEPKQAPTERKTGS